MTNRKFFISSDKVIYKGEVRTIYSTYSDTMVSLCLIDEYGYEYDDVEEDWQVPISELTTIKQLEIMETRIGFCEHTQTEIVQEKFGDEWVCIHEDTREQELENINQIKQQLNN